MTNDENITQEISDRFPDPMTSSFVGGFFGGTLLVILIFILSGIFSGCGAIGYGKFEADVDADGDLRTHKSTDAMVTCGYHKLPEQPTDKQMKRYQDCVVAYSANTNTEVTARATLDTGEDAE